MPRAHRYRVHATRALVALLVATSTATAALPAHAASTPKRRPNILFVLTDDQDLASLADMPKTRRLIGDRGATFENAFVSDSVCCPSRMTILRGQYAHNTGVLTNSGGNGGFHRAYALGLEHDTIATRLHDAGYTTGLFGKYLNKYPTSAGRSYVPPGWDDWASAIRGRPYGQYDYDLNENGVIRHYGITRADYGTDVFMDHAQRFIERSVEQGTPFFAYVAPYAPHSPSTPARGDGKRFASRRAPRSPAFNLADVSRMPAFIRGLPLLTDSEIDVIDELYRRRLRSLQAIDRGVARLVKSLRDVGQLDNTYIVFTSDNGHHLGQHRLPAGKSTAYDTDIRVPLLIRGPGVKAGTRIPRFVGNVDFAPTFAAIAGAPTIPYADGRSLLGLLHGRRPALWRVAQVVERWEGMHKDGTPYRQDHLDPDDASEPDDPDQLQPGLTSEPPPADFRGPNALNDQNLLARFARIPGYTAVRTHRYLYVEYNNGERELYDVIKDPDQAENLAGGTLGAIEQRLSQRLAELRTCRGESCRTADRLPIP